MTTTASASCATNTTTQLRGDACRVLSDITGMESFALNVQKDTTKMAACIARTGRFGIRRLKSATSVLNTGILCTTSAKPAATCMGQNLTGILLSKNACTVHSTRS